MLRLTLQTGRRRIASLAAVAGAAFGCAALVTGIGVLAESGFRSHAPVGRLALADVVVSGGQTYRPPGDLPIALPDRVRVPAGLVDRLARLDGVTAAIGDVSFPAAVVGKDDQVVPLADPRTAGHGWSSVGLLDRPAVAGTPPVASSEVALDARTAAAAGARTGSTVRMVVAGHEGEYRVTAVLSTVEPGSYFADSVAAGFVPAGTVDLIALQVAPGAHPDIRSVAGGLLVSTGADRGDVEAPGIAAARTVLPAIAGSLAGVTLLVIGFIVGGALAVSVAAQRREIALMRAVGATPRQVRRLVAGQATAVAVGAALPGIAAGYPLAERFRELLVSAGLLPPALPLTFGPLPAVAAVLLLVVVVQVAARSAAWRTSRRPATEAVAESRTEPRTPAAWRGFAGLLLIAGSCVLSVMPLLVRSPIGAAGTALAGIVAAIGLGLAGPALVQRITAWLGRRSRGFSAPAWLAVANSHGYALRAAGAVTTLAMAVTFTLTYALTQTTVLSATSADLRDGTRAQLALSAPALGGVPDGVLAAARATPGVLAAAPVRSTTVLWPYPFAGDTEVEAGPALVLGPEAAGVLDLDVRGGSLAGLTGATVAVDAGLADARHARVGQDIRLILGDGTPVTARVVAVYGRGLGFGPVVLSRDLARDPALDPATAGLDERVLVRTDGTDAARRNLSALAASRPGLLLAGANPARHTAIPPELLINVAVLVVLLGYLLLAIANRLVATTTQRRGELALLQLVGATPAQVRSMMRREAALICAIALGTGAVLTVVPLVLLSAGFLHRSWPAGPVWLLPATAAVVAAIAFLAIELPTRRALRTPPLSSA